MYGKYNLITYQIFAFQRFRLSLPSLSLIFHYYESLSTIILLAKCNHLNVFYHTKNLSIFSLKFITISFESYYYKSALLNGITCHDQQFAIQHCHFEINNSFGLIIKSIDQDNTKYREHYSNRQFKVQETMYNNYLIPTLLSKQHNTRMEESYLHLGTQCPLAVLLDILDTSILFLNDVPLTDKSVSTPYDVMHFEEDINNLYTNVNLYILFSKHT